MSPPGDLDSLARRLTALAPSCGPVRLIGVDGHAGSGKSTLAGRLSGALDGAPVLHLDDFASHGALFDWTDRLTTQVTGPLSRGTTAHFLGYDWHRRAFTLPGEVGPEPVVLVEGVGAGRRALRPLLACLVWMEMPRPEAWARGMRRDGPEQKEFWAGWARAERAHFAADPSRPYARYLVRKGDMGYRVSEGPGMRRNDREDITVGDMSTAPSGSRQAKGPGRA